jgi:hypothetical protein
MHELAVSWLIARQPEGSAPYATRPQMSPDHLRGNLKISSTK